MKAIVLAGGYATRLRPLTYTIPKLLFPVMGKPMVFWTLDLLQKFGVDEVVLGVNYLADKLRETVGEEYRGIRVRYSLEDKPLGTGGPIKLASELIRPTETFLAMNGDVIAELDIGKMLQKHRSLNASVTDALHEVRNPSRFGVVELDREGRIREFVEKPKPGKEPSRFVNAGIYLIEPKVLEQIPQAKKVSLEREIFPILANAGKLGGYTFSGFWSDIGSLTDYRESNFAMLRINAGNKPMLQTSVTVSDGAVLKPPVLIGEGTKVDRNCTIGPNTLIGKRGMVGKNTRVSKSIFFDSVTVGEGSVITGVVVGPDVKIGDDVRIGSGAVVSANVIISDGVKIGAGAIVHPHKEIDGDIKAGTHVL